MKNIRNLKIIGVGILLSGISIFLINKYPGDENKPLETLTNLSYDTETKKMTGTLSYEEVSENIKIVTFEENGNQFEELMYVYEKDTNFPLSKRYAYIYQTSYIRLEDGWEMASYDYVSKEEQEKRNHIRSYEQFNVIREKNFLDSLLEYVDRKENYEVEEILEIYHNKASSKIKDNQGEVKTYGQKN